MRTIPQASKGRRAQKPGQRRKRGAYALVSTLMAVTLISIMVVAFISNAGIDRSASNSYKTAFLAEQAVMAGFEAAKTQLLTYAKGDDYLIVKAEDRNAVINDPLNLKAEHLYAAKWDTAVSKFKLSPLFAGGKDRELGVAEVLAPPGTNDWQADLTVTDPSSPKLPDYLPHPETRWISINSDVTSRSQPKVRYTYWIRDAEGLLNLREVGNIKTSSELHTFPVTVVPDDTNPLDPEYTPVFPIFNRTWHKEQLGQEGSKWDNRLILLKDYLLTQGTAFQLASLDVPDGLLPEPPPPKLGSTQLELLEKFTFAGAKPYSVAERIPFGHGYVDQGKPRIALNAEIESAGAGPSESQTAVAKISSHILRNLPNFEQRKGGFAFGVQGGELGETSAERVQQSYTKTIVASMIDYADEDSLPTSHTDYRGIDSYPMVNEIAERYERLANGSWPVSLDVRYYYELWNMTNQPIKGDVTLIYHNKQGIEAPANRLFGTFKSDPIPVDIAPNQFHVVEFVHTEDGSPLKRGPSGGPTAPPDNLEFYSPETYNSNFELYFDGFLVDSISGTGTGSGRTNMVRRYGGSYNYQYPLNKNQPPSWNHTGSGASVEYSQSRFGDPRISFYMHTYSHAHWYEKRGSMWGRNKLYGLTNSNFNEITLSRWPDFYTTSPTSTSFAYNTPVGNSAEISSGITNSNQMPQWPRISPTDANYKRPTTDAQQADKAVQIISNAGKYYSIAEIGNIFDPAQWRGNLQSGGSPSNQSGGGMTLAVGRPDFAPMNPRLAPGMINGFTAANSAQAYHANLLMDLLTTDELVDYTGKININTAPFEVLRAMAVGEFERDTVKLPTALQPMTKTAAADSFAKSVVAARPFYSPSQFADMKAHGVTAQYFGNMTLHTNNTLNNNTNIPTAAHDRTVEELFRRVYSQTSLKSRNFQVFVTGQVYIPGDETKPDRVLSTNTMEFDVFLEPERDNTNNIVRVEAKVLRELAH